MIDIVSIGACTCDSIWAMIAATPATVAGDRPWSSLSRMKAICGYAGHAQCRKRVAPRQESHLKTLEGRSCFHRHLGS